MTSESLIREIETHYILHWNYKHLWGLPAELLERGGHVQEIYLKDNHLTMIPESLSQHLPNLTNLYLPGNQMREFPTCLKALKSLRVLDLRHNRLETLDFGDGQDQESAYESLQDLDLSENFLNELPSCLGNDRLFNTRNI